MFFFIENIHISLNLEIKRVALLTLQLVLPGPPLRPRSGNASAGEADIGLELKL